ncbi:ATP-binding cassette domain-containing protein [Telmatospirillum siberiense]|uniref:Aliphatic sulfonate ABC transporter ATP-binding protein n=1 Tax=Telmatospirillum siberiense TaxID=382514 RepID=A0A2N3PU90_9PROT|nr:ATP-binding cassette domain-containing protein [Telmatospirillum siberiense]PKU23974.1 aliphatic sulfonate ABC transporter ATP-binding protein [Telmatospirillum siberiense]
MNRNSALERPLPDTAGENGRGVGVSVQALSRSFGALQVLRRLDLTIEAGQFVCIVGRSGCGKSTLLRHLAGLETPDAGLALVNGEERNRVHGNTRVMFQEARLLPWKTVLGNVGVGLKGDWRARALAALSQVGLADRAGDWPFTLSGGQRQRVALARALVHSPRLLLFDEPLGALDALTRIEMQELIERLWLEQGFTALLVTHDVAEAVALADRVILIENGAVALDLPITLPRPRERGVADFARMEGLVLKRVLTHHDGNRQ